MTQAEIARELGVSQSAVSLVLKNPDTSRVSKENRSRIINYLRSVNYRGFQESCRGMKRIIHFINGVLSHEPFYKEYQHGVIEQAAAFNIDVVVKNYVGKMSANYLDKESSGFILQGNLTDEEINIFASKRPTVLLNSYSERHICDIANPDNFATVRMAAEYLFEKGHRRIGFWLMCRSTEGNLGNMHFFERLHGYKMMMAVLGLKEHLFMYQINDCTLDEVARQAGQTLLENREAAEPVTAFITAGYVYGLEMIKTAFSLGIKIPDEAAVISIDDVPAAEYSQPPMTCIRQNRDEMGRLAVDLLVQRAISPERGFKRVGCSPTLVKRISA